MTPAGMGWEVAMGAATAAAMEAEATAAGAMVAGTAAAEMAEEV